MKPFCIHCQTFMIPLPVKPIVVTKAGPQWAGTLYKCSTCKNSTITEWNYNAEELTPLTLAQRNNLRKKFFPYYFEEK